MSATLDPPSGIDRLLENLHDLRRCIAPPSLWARGDVPHDVRALTDSLLAQVEGLASRLSELTESNRALEREVAEHERTEHALREREGESRLIMDTIPGMVALLSATGEIELLNRQLLDYFGQTPDELREWATNGTIHPDDVAHVIDVFSHSIASGSPYDIVQRFRRGDGVYRWFQNRGFPLHDRGGRIVRWCVLLTDVDERKRAEDALRESERQSRLIVESIPGLIATLTPAGEVEFVNRQALEYFGKTLDDLKDWENTQTTHPEDLPRVVEQFAQAIASGQAFEFEHRARRADGVYRWFQSRGLPLRDSQGHIVRWYNLLIDVDERKQREAALKRSEAFLAEGQRLSLTGSFSWRVATDEITWSEQLYRIYDIEPGTRVTPALIRTRVHPEDVSLLERMKSVDAGGQRGEFEWQYRLLMPDGSIKYLHAVSHAIEDADGRLEYIAAVQDVTEQRLSEEAIAKARSELAKVVSATSLGVLTAAIAHEVNQPLSGIITNAGTCLRMLDAAPPNVEGARETARRTIRDGNRASDVITRLRALFGRREFPIEPVDLNEATREVIALSTNDLQRNRITLLSEFGEGLPAVTGDRIQLQQVILNLLRNASEAMAGVEDRPRHLWIRTERKIDAVRLTIRDSGAGLHPDSVKSLFDAFFTTKKGGMGIGLFVSRSIIERHHGRLWAEPNVVSPGATFSFSIPCGPEAMSVAEMVTPAR